MKREQITHTELLDKIRYNSKTGIFYNRQTGQRIGHYDASNNLVFKLPANNVSDGNWIVGTTPQYKSGGTVADDYHSKENFLKRFWMWLNG